MTTAYDTLAERTSLWRPFCGSLTLHVSLGVTMLFYGWMLARNKIRFGDPTAVPGGVVPINITSSLPLAPAQTVFQNPVASPIRSAVPTPPPDAPREQERVEAVEAAVPLPGAKTRPRQEQVPRRFRAYVPDRDNQLYSLAAPGVNTPSYGSPTQAAFGVGIGVGAGSPFGARYAWYAEALQRRIGEQWNKELLSVDSGLRTAPRTVVFFEILRDGTLRNISISQSSGNQSVDYTALRAVTNANPVPPLPADLGRASVSTEIWFQLKR